MNTSTLPAADTSIKKLELLPLLISILITLGVGLSASEFTRPQIASWYHTLNKPDFTPPGWLFGPVWSVLYIMMAVSAYLIWKRRSIAPVYYCSKAYYFIQLTLNFLWSLTFFSLHEIDLALADIVLLFISIIGTMYYFSRVYKTAALMLLPYLIWVGYATALNASICLLNK